MKRLAFLISGRVILGAGSVLAVLLSYSWVTGLPDNNPALLPPIPHIGQAFVVNLTRGSLIDALGASLYRISMGFAIGTSCALVLGCLIGWYKTIEYLLDPLIEAVRPIPPLAYIPIVIIFHRAEDPAQTGNLWSSEPAHRERMLRRLRDLMEDEGCPEEQLDRLGLAGAVFAA